MRKLAIAVLLFVLANAAPSAAASLTFIPRGTMVDSDAILDIVMAPGQQVSFTIMVNTAGLENFERLIAFSYVIDYDGSELQSAGAAFDIERMFPVIGAPDLSASGVIISHGTSATQPLGLPPNETHTLDIIRFTAQPGLVNNGNSDFSITVVAATAFELGSGAQRSVLNLFLDNRQQMVEVQPIPEPATWLLAAFGFVATLMRKGKAMTARAPLVPLQLRHSRSALMCRAAVPAEQRRRKVSTQSMVAMLWTLVSSLVAQPAFADPITGPIWDTDTIDQLVLKFHHGAVDELVDSHVFRSEVSPMGFWEFENLTIGEFGSGISDFDAVTVTGRLFRHVRGPEESSKGDPFTFFLMIPTTDFLFSDSLSEDVSHPGQGHVDRWNAVLDATLQPGSRGEIKNYQLTITATHNPVPEPATIIMVGVGLACVRRRLRYR